MYRFKNKIKVDGIALSLGEKNFRSINKPVGKIAAWPPSLSVTYNTSDMLDMSFLFFHLVAGSLKSVLLYFHQNM